MTGREPPNTVQPVEHGLHIGRLIKQLCEAHGSYALRTEHRIAYEKALLYKKLYNVAFSLLLGLDEDATPLTHGIDDLDQRLQASSNQLSTSGYPDLGSRLTALSRRLRQCTSCSVIAPSSTTLRHVSVGGTTPFRDHDALLRLMFSLHGSRPSIRHRRATFQPRPCALTANLSSPSTARSCVAINSGLFREPPDPEAFFRDPMNAALVVLETEGPGVLPAAALADIDEVTKLNMGMDARPTWSPMAPESLRSIDVTRGWLPVPRGLQLERMDEDRRNRAVALGVSISTLAMDSTPGSTTVFALDGGISGSPLEGRTRGYQKVLSVEQQRATEVGVRTPETRRAEFMLGSESMWTLEEAELASDALHALQGVHSALLRLRGALSAVQALPRRPVAGVLARIERAATCRYQLQGFVDAFGSVGSHNNTASRPDAVLRSFASCVGTILRDLNSTLAAIEAKHASEWVRGVVLNGSRESKISNGGPKGKVLYGRGLSLTRISVLTIDIQRRLRTLAALCWCGPSTGAGSDECCTWQTQPPPQGPILLEYLYQQWYQTDDPQYKKTIHRLFVHAAEPYFQLLCRWPFSTADLDPKRDWPYVVHRHERDHALSPHNVQGAHKGGSAVPPGGTSLKQALVPGPLPGFLAHLQIPLIQAGAQLRLLHSYEHETSLAPAHLTLTERLCSNRLSPLTWTPDEKAGVETAGLEAIDFDSIGQQQHGWLEIDAQTMNRIDIRGALLLDDAARGQAVDTWIETLRSGHPISTRSSVLLPVELVMPTRGSDVVANEPKEHVLVESGRLSHLGAELEVTLGGAIISQHVATSRACMALILDHAHLASHIQFLKRTFFQEAGDWAEALLAPLATKVSELQPLTQHDAYSALQTALKMSSLEREPLANGLELDLISGPPAPAVLLSVFHKKENLSMEDSFATLARTSSSSQAASPLLIAPSRLDGLDCLLLRYRVDWPLAAVIPEDTLVHYAGIFSAMMRTRRVAWTLRKIRAATMASARKSMLGDAVTDFTMQQVQLFLYTAMQFCIAVQAFQNACVLDAKWQKLEAASGGADKGGGDAIDNVQSLLELHRDCVRTSAHDCLTFCGRPVVRKAVESTLELSLEVANKLDAAMLGVGEHAGSGSSFGVALGKSSRWPAVQEGLGAFDAVRKEALGALDVHAEGSPKLRYLAAMASLRNADAQPQHEQHNSSSQTSL